MRKYSNFVVGMNENDEVVLIDRVEFRDDNEFSIVFTTWSLESFNNRACQDKAESYIDCMEKDWLYDRCEEYDCKPSELQEYIANDLTVDDVFDFNSIYSAEFQDEDGDDVYLNFSCSTPRDYEYSPIVKYVNSDIEKIFALANRVGKEYHLKKIPTDEGNALMDIFEEYDNRDMFDTDIEFIKNSMN